MGVLIDISMNPFKIDPDQWKEAFREAMIISRYEGLACIKEKVYNNTVVPCLTYASASLVKDSESFVLEKYLEKNKTSSIRHWKCIGDMLTGSNMESFSLHDDIGFYRYTCTNPYCRVINIDMQKAMQDEILFQHIYPKNYDMRYGNYEEAIACVMAGMTQGERGHMGLLEIGCMLADRFPDAVAIRGDITHAQCMIAIERVKEILGRSVVLPIQYEYKRIFERLSEVVQDRDDLLKLLDDIYDQSKEQDYYDFLKRNFTEQELSQHFITQYWSHKRMLIKSWFCVDMSFEKLCAFIVDRYEGCDTYSKEVRELVEALIRSKIYVEGSQAKKSTKHSLFHEEKENVTDELLRKILKRIDKFEIKYIDRYIPLEELMSVCTKYFGEQFDVKSAFGEILDKMSETEKEVFEGSIEPEIKYTHVGYSSLYGWEREDTVSPRLDENLLLSVERLKEFGEDVINEYSEKYKKNGSESQLTDWDNYIEFIKNNTSHTVLFTEDDLDVILSEGFPRTSTLGSVIIGLYLMKWSYTIENLIRGLVLNFELLQYYVERWEKARNV